MAILTVIACAGVTAAIANAAKLKKSFDAIAQQLSTVTITLTKQAGEADKLYGSVTTKEISDALKAKGFDVEKKRVELPEVRTLGTFEVKAKLAPEVVATFKLEVVKK